MGKSQRYISQYVLGEYETSFRTISAMLTYVVLNFYPTILPCSEGLEVTDDVSIVEHLKHPVYITEGSYTNIKVVKKLPFL